MRYLSESFAVGALRRSASIEQFLGPAFHRERRGIRWVAIEPRRNGRYAVVLYLSWDVGGEQFRDLLEFPPLDADAEDDGEVVAEVDDAAAAIEAAERATDAVRERWANFGVAAEDYLDYVRFGRLPDPLTKAAATDVVRTLLTTGGGDDRTVAWQLDGLARRTGCLHISDLIYFSYIQHHPSQFHRHLVGLWHRRCTRAASMAEILRTDVEELTVGQASSTACWRPPEVNPGGVGAGADSVPVSVPHVPAVTYWQTALL